MIIIIIIVIEMDKLKINELNNTENLIIECIRCWIKSIVFQKNPIPPLIKILTSHNLLEAVLPIDDFMKYISLSSVKMYDFRKTNCIYVGETEKEILLILYLYKFNKNIALNYIQNLVDNKFIKMTIASTRQISDSFTSSGKTFQNPISYTNVKQLNNVVIYDFKNKVII